MNWKDAQNYCREKFTDLASLHNEQDLIELKTIATPHFKGFVWLGLYFDSNNWRWSLEKEGYYGEGEAEFRMWLKGKPNNKKASENCVVMKNDGFWNDALCQNQNLFVCYNGKKNKLLLQRLLFHLLNTRNTALAPWCC